MTAYNPYAIYVHCDAAMDYDSENSGGIGFEIVFPESVEADSIKKSIGKFTDANIERLELEAILQGMKALYKVWESIAEQLKNVKTVIVTTDRYGLNDQEKTSPYRINEWRKNKWHNHEGKAIKNSDLLDAVDKFRKKLINDAGCFLEINYLRRKFNRSANNLAKKAKKLMINRRSIATKGLKICKRKYDGSEINYRVLKDKEKYIVRIFKKQLVRDQLEICAEFCEGEHVGRKITIYSNEIMQRRMHMHHCYEIRIKSVFTHHVVVFRTTREKLNKKKELIVN